MIRPSRIPLGLALLLSIAWTAPGSASAAGSCVEQSLHGTYGVKFDGNSDQLGHFASVSLWTFDGRGGMKASETFDSDETGPATRTVEGSYEIESNCSFALFFPSSLGHEHVAVGACVLVDNGKEFYCVDVESGWVASGIGKRV
jgi:hypothetical protein